MSKLDHEAFSPVSPEHRSRGLSVKLVGCCCVLAGILTFILIERHSGREVAPVEANRAASSGPFERLSGTTSRSPSATTDEERIAAYREARRRSDEADRQASDTYRSHKGTYTPEVRARLVESEMNYRMPGYQRLFDEWNLTQDVRAELVKSIRAREQNSIDNILNYTGDGAQDHKGLQTKDLINEGVAELELKALLGDERFRQLVAYEKKLQQEAREKRLEARRPGG